MENHGDLRYLKAEGKTREAEPKPAAPAAPAAEPCTAPFALRPSVGTWHLSCAGFQPDSLQILEVGICWIINLIIGLLGVYLGLVGWTRQRPSTPFDQYDPFELRSPAPLCWHRHRHLRYMPLKTPITVPAAPAAAAPAAAPVAAAPTPAAVAPLPGPPFALRPSVGTWYTPLQADGFRFWEFNVADFDLWIILNCFLRVEHKLGCEDCKVIEDWNVKVWLPLAARTNPMACGMLQRCWASKAWGIPWRSAARQSACWPRRSLRHLVTTWSHLDLENHMKIMNNPIRMGQSPAKPTIFLKISYLDMGMRLFWRSNNFKYASTRIQRFSPRAFTGYTAVVEY